MIHKDEIWGECFYVPNALIDDTTLTRCEKLVLISLIRHYDVEWKCSYPTVGTIADEARLSRRQTISTLQMLALHGHIRAERDPGYVTQYEILTPEFKPREA